MPGGHTTNYVFLLGSAGLDIDCLVDRPLIIPFVEVTGFGVYTVPGEQTANYALC